MKKNILFLATVILFISCEKYAEPVAIITPSTGKATVQFFNAAVGTGKNLVYIDTKLLNKTLLNTNTVLPTNTMGYEVISGSHDLAVRDTTAGSLQSFLGFIHNFEANSSYTTFMYNNFSAIKQLTIKNNFVFPSDTVSLLRFANFLYNTTPLTGVDVYSVKKASNIFTNVAQNTVTDYIPYVSIASDTFRIFQTGTSTLITSSPASATSFNGFSTTFKRASSIVLSGMSTGTKTLSGFAQR
ncbi:MAG: hypothetical protein ABL929_03570 [Ferruginibacter sp.]|nr:hypothetical protein [Ferruginibacter sp.]